MKLVAYNTSFGLFELSQLAIDEIVKKKNLKSTDDMKFFAQLMRNENNTRSDVDVTEIVSKLGSKASSVDSDIKLAHIPDGADFKIADNEGIETVYYGHDLHIISENGLDSEFD